MSEDTAPRGRKEKPAPERGADTAGPAPETAGAAADASAAPSPEGDLLVCLGLSALTIRCFARTGDGEIARERGRPIVEERPLRPDDIISRREDEDIVHLILADGRYIRVKP